MEGVNVVGQNADTDTLADGGNGGRRLVHL